MDISPTNIPESHSHDRQLTKPRYEVADIFNRYLDEYLRTHKLSQLQRKIVDAIMSCRTARLGGHILKCDVCGYERKEHNSCRNRHCPKCQGSKKVKWVQQRLAELLPIPYYHSVQTMPHSLNPLALYNKAVIYDLLFKSASHTFNEFSKDPRFLGAKLGFTGILHTWGQALPYHVHLHFIVTGGGISHDGKRWVKLPYQKKFLFPVEAMSRRMRKRFSELLQKAYDQGKLVFPDDLSYLKEPEQFKRFLNKVAWENWVTYVEAPFAGPEEVVKYIGRYTHRVAISNHRILDIEDGKVTFGYKQYKDNQATYKTMTLKADEFIGRFLLHVLPAGFKRIRHFGFLSNGLRSKYIHLARELLDALVEKIEQAQSTFDDWLDRMVKCPKCQIGTLFLQEVFKPIEPVPG